MDNQINNDNAVPVRSKGSFAIYDVQGTKQKIKNIFDACERGNYKAIMAFAKGKDFDVDAKDRYGRTALIWAADCGHAQVCEALIRLNANIHVIDSFTGRSALHWAARCGSLPIVRLLVAYGADINKEDKYSLTPLYLAKSKGLDAEEVFNYLRSEGANYNEQKTFCSTEIEANIMAEMASLDKLDEE
eukprot:Gb_30524 [translate_table: standard]